ncbi:MFS transporter [Streptomyces sp. H39-S7]|uniref:MFS transporter n=1 Tax=Streptomyces sp. H39-S7 TaxID=3004357 RepID=UPI0022AEC177|nr:MFS transporter [Streptomyces sp. H39-S7]MCZ4121908.1 MFS transporter [Streptomyces sp. H39-S7]
MGPKARGGRLPRTVWLLLAARAINRLGAFSLSFLAVLISTDFGASVATAGLVSAAFGLATIPSRLAGGRLADHLGRRRTIVLGLTGCAVAQLGIAAAQSLTAVAIFAVLLGLVFELYEPPSQAMIADCVGPADRVRAYSLLNAALAVGGMGAGLIATGLGRWDLRWLFVADALSCLACAVIIRLVLPGDRPLRRDPTVLRASERSVGIKPWRDRTLLLLLGCGTVSALVYLQVMMALPLSLARRGMRPADAGVLFTVSALTIVVAQPLLRLRRLAELSAPAALALGHVVLAAGLAGYAAAHTLTGSLVATVVWSLGDLVILGRSYALVADLAPPGGTGRYLAVYGISWGFAGVAAPIAGTQILEHAGPAFLWSGLAATSLALAAGQILVARVLAARESAPAEGISTTRPALRDGTRAQ